MKDTMMRMEGMKWKDERCRGTGSRYPTGLTIRMETVVNGRVSLATAPPLRIDAGDSTPIGVLKSLKNRTAFNTKRRG
jgi:hypothetical protein